MAVFCLHYHFFSYLQEKIVCVHFLSNCIFCFVNCSEPLPIYLLSFNVFLRILLAFLYSAHINPFDISTTIFPVLFATSFGYLYFLKNLLLLFCIQIFNLSNLSIFFFMISP